MRRVALGFAFLLGLVAAGLAYLQTSHGFRHVIVPAVASLSETEVSARDGYLSLAGRLAIDGLQFKAPKKGIEVDAERIYLSFSLLPVFRKELPVVHELEINTATVALIEQVKVDEPTGPSTREREGMPLLVPVVIEQAKINGLTLTSQASSGTTALRDAILSVEHLEPGQTGTIKLATNLTYERGASAVPISAAVMLNMALEQNPTADRFKWNGTNTVVVESGVPEPEADRSQAITFAQTLSGQYEVVTRQLNLVSDIAAKRGDTAMGRSRAEVRLEGEKDQQQLQATLTVEELTGEALTALLMGISPAQFESGRIDGQVQISRKGKVVGIRAALAGHRLSLRHGTQATPPVDLKVDQVGTYDESSHVLSVEALNVIISDEMRQLITAGLDHPVVLSLASGPGETTGEPAQSADPSSKDQLVGVRLGLHGMTVRELRPWLTLSGRDLLPSFADGELNGTADLTVLNRGRTVDLNGRLNLTKAMIQDDRGVAFLGPVTIQTETHAALTDFAALKVERSSMSVLLKTKQVARLAASGAVQLHAPAKITALEGYLTVNALPLEAVNHLLARHGPTRVQHAVLDGEGTVRVNGDRIEWDAKLEGTQLSMRLPDMATATPPLEVHLEQTGALDQVSHRLHLKALAIQVLEGRRQVILGTLDKPLVIPLSQHEARSAGAVEAAPITLSLEFSRLGVRQIRPWVAITGSSILTQVRSGEVNGRFQLNVRGAANHVDLTGNLDLTEFQLERRGSHVMAAPVAIRSRVRAAVSDLAQIKLDTYTVQVSAGPESLAEINGAGIVDGKNGKVDVKVQATSANLSETLDRLGLLTPKQRKLIDGGQLKSESIMATAGTGQPLKLSTTLRLDTLAVRLDSQHVLTRSVEGHGAIVLNADRSEARLDQVSMTLLSNGASAGVMTLSGHWPITGSQAGGPPNAVQKPVPSGELGIVIKDWDASMPVSFFDILPGREPNPLPVNLSITMKQEPAKQAMTVRGRGSVGPLRPVAKGGTADAKTIQFEEEVTSRGNEVEIAALKLSSEGPRGHADQVTVTGVVRMGTRPRIQARGKVEALDVKWIADLLTDPGKPEQSDQAVAAVGAAPLAPAHTGKGFPADLDVEIEIGSVIHRGLKLERGRLIARGVGGNLHTTLSPTKVAGGTVEATADVTMVRDEPQIKWSAQGKQVAIEILLQGGGSNGEAPVTGLASFTTNGAARGSGENLKRTLNGTATFDVKEGRVVKSDLLAYMAKQTKIDEIEHLGFDAVHGKLHAQDGWIVLDRIHVISPAIVLDAVGKVGLDGKLDVKVSPRVSAGLAHKVGGACVAPLLHTVDGFTLFPFAVVVKGTTQQPAFGLEVRADTILEKNASLLVGGIMKTLTGCGEQSVQGGAEAVDTLKGAAQDLFEGLMGGGSKPRTGQ